MLVALIVGVFFAVWFSLAQKIVFAVTIAEQTQNFGNQLNVWQAIQELGNNLSGIAQSFTFRVSTSQPNNFQFDFTALNSRIYDKEDNSYIIPCVTNAGDPFNALTFTTQGVPLGYQDVTIDFSCRNYQFIPGHRYLIYISNANLPNLVAGLIRFGSAAYGPGGEQTTDRFTAGGLRYANGNPFDFSHNSGSCSPTQYIWGDTTVNPVSGCNIFTSPQDDLYFILTNTAPESPPKTPVIFIPGIGGSELKVLEDTIWSKDNGHEGIFNYTYAKDEKVWINEGEAANPGEDDYFDVLRMKTDGVTSEANLGLTGNLFSGYQEAINFFISIGYILNQDLFIFPYDWRKDNTESTELLDQKIQSIKTQTGSQKVDVVTHSMGGLVAREYISEPQKAQNVRKLFTLGTPHLGSVESLKNIVRGGCLTKLTLLAQFICLGISPSEVKDVIQNMISGFQLAPSQIYFNFYNNEDNQHPYPYRTEAGALNYNQIKDFLTTLGHNTLLFTPSETFHSIDSTLSNTNGVDVVVIAGSGQPTLGQIIEQKTVSLLGIEGNHKDIRIINGDDTVPLFSASLNDPSNNQSLLGSAKLYYTNQKHGSLVATGSALDLVKNILEGNNQLPSGISQQPLNLSGNLLSVHSPVNIHAYDSNGNHTGPTPDGDFEVNIPGSSYDTLGDTKFIFLPEDGVYIINFEATDNGSFDFKIRKFENDQTSETILYKEIPLTNNTTAETTFDTNSDLPPVINVDEDGNGTVDSNFEKFSVLEGDANYDYTPPVVGSFDVTPKTIWQTNNKMVDVTISGTITDDNPYLTTIIVDDEYNLVEPTIQLTNQTEINQTIKLKASRRGNDKDGRKYKIKMLATDLAGNTSLSTLEVVVPHDKGKKK